MTHSTLACFSRQITALRSCGTSHNNAHSSHDHRMARTRHQRTANATPQEGSRRRRGLGRPLDGMDAQQKQRGRHARRCAARPGGVVRDGFTTRGGRPAEAGQHGFWEEYFQYIQAPLRRAQIARGRPADRLCGAGPILARWPTRRSGPSTATSKTADGPRASKVHALPQALAPRPGDGGAARRGLLRVPLGRRRVAALRRAIVSETSARSWACRGSCTGKRSSP